MLLYELLINRLCSFATCAIYQPVTNNKLKFITYILVAFISALVLSLTIGEKYDGSGRIVRSSPKRQTRDTSQQSSASNFKDPFANRPRIRTKNGHLVIEASQNKNIDFKTNGPRGSVTINGHNLDQLLDVTKALEKSAQLTGNNSTKFDGAQYEPLVNSLLYSGERITNLQKDLNDLKKQVKELSGKLMKLTKQHTRRANQLKKTIKQQESILVKLKQNDCFNSETGNSICKNGATCLDTYEGFKCLCPPNYEGLTCENDVDECAKFRGTDLGCQNGAKCINLPGSYKCECPSQYHGVHCTEQHDDCALSSSRSLCGNGKCINLARTVPNQAKYECLCDQGWTTDGSNPACTIDINECLAGSTSFLTFNSSSDSSIAWPTNSLMVAYPCSQNPFVDCINLPGSFKCGPCPSGFTGNGRVCRDIDECESQNGGCSMAPLVECINTPGSVRCGLCPAGYTGDGLTCSRISACSSEPNGGCHPMAKCLDLPAMSVSSRLCLCQYPYAGEGVGQAGCRMVPNGIGPSSPIGNRSSIDEQVLMKQDDCNPSSCLNNAECLKTETSFECICPLGWIGKLCGEPSSICGNAYYTSRGSVKFPLGGSYNELLKLTNSDSIAAAAEGQPVDNKSTSRHYKCNWKITVPLNMSVQLIFSELVNKMNPNKKVQMLLSNVTTANHRLQSDVNCDEYLAVKEFVDSDQYADGKRLLARFCTDSHGSQLSPVSPNYKRGLVILAESNSIELEYEFSATRTQFGEPSLGFGLNWTKIEPPCGGSLPLAESGSISSPKFPEFYPAGTECRYLVQVPPGKRIRIQFGELNLLTTSRQRSGSCADSLTILDGSIGTDRPVLFKHCANKITMRSKAEGPSPSSLVSSSSKIEIVFISEPDSTAPLMKPKQKRGFYLTYASESGEPICGGLYTTKAGTIKSADYEPAIQVASGSNLAMQLPMHFESSENFGFYRSLPSIWSKPPKEDGIGKDLFEKNYCEFEIRPSNQARNHRIAIDWIEMPNEAQTEPDSLSHWTRRIRCSKGRLRIYDGNSLDKSNRTLIASFCAGDKYNSSFISAMPIVSSGHILILTYQSSHTPSNKQQDYSNIGPNGFKLHYSTICTSIYTQLSNSILVEIDPEVPECLYHIILPPDNTISMIIAPKMSETMFLPDGSCAAQAIFIDGAVQQGAKQLIETEKKLRTYSFRQQVESLDSSNQSSRVGVDDANSGPRLSSATATTSQTPTTSGNSYWQYSSSYVHDIKEFEACKLPVLGFDSIWNHLSLMFRLNPRAKKRNLAESFVGQKLSVQLIVKYQAESSCGGIITADSNLESITLNSSRKVENIKSSTANRYEQLHKNEFMDPCAWILAAKPTQYIRMTFSVPVDEIKSQYSNWLSWKKSQKNTTSASSDTSENQDFNCSQVYQESIELYEPSMNRTRHLCPLDLTNNSTTWLTQSSVVYIRLHNTSLPISTNKSSSSLITTWPGIKPLVGLTVKSAFKVQWNFISPRDFHCGGKLLQDSGIINSPRFPFNYRSNSNCIWIIQGNPRQQIRLNFTKFILEYQNTCLYDYLELRNGPNEDSPLIGRFCGDDLQSKVIMSHSNAIWMQFKSDAHLNRPGFEIYFDGAQTGCGGKLNTPRGQIDSPNYPQPFAHSSDCEWTIEVSRSNRIELTFDDLDLMNSQSDVADVGRDRSSSYIEVIDFGPEFGSKSLGKYYHIHELIKRNSSIKSSSNKLVIIYKSQALDNSRGFRLTYQTVCSNIELSGHKGVIESPGYPSGYLPQLNCGWILRTSLGNNITLAITDLELEDRVSPSDQLYTTSDTSKQNSSKLKCLEDALEIWSLPTQMNRTKLSVEFVLSNVRDKLQRPLSGKLVQNLCGNNNLTSQMIELDTNIAFIGFKTDRSVQLRGFRIEWATRGCGGYQFGNEDDIKKIEYHEPIATGRPIECEWIYDFSFLGSIDFIFIFSDMRVPENSISNPCEDASLTLYDGISPNASALFSNCDSQRVREHVQTSSSKALIRFYSSGKHNFGRGFSVSGWPGGRDSCIGGALDYTAPYNQEAGLRRSPNYPDLYEVQSYRCMSFISSRVSRTRIHIQELDIPISPDSSQASGLLDPKVCKDSGNYLLIKTWSSASTEEYFCGKLDARNGEKDLNRTTVIFRQESAYIEFHTQGGFRGRWGFTYGRLCGSLIDVTRPIDLKSPNYPARPNWIKNSNDDDVNQSENVCIWNLRSSLINSDILFTRESSAGTKIHINIANFIESAQVKDRPSDCLRIFEGSDIDLKQSFFNLTEIDAKMRPKIKICKQSDIKYSDLNYVSQGNDLIVLSSGETRFKLKVKPFEDHCGGEFILNQAEFASSGYPQPYTSDLDCNYYIIGSPGSRINLKFLKFDLPEGELDDDDDNSTSSCDNVDSVEIRQLPIGNKLIARSKLINKQHSSTSSYLSIQTNSTERVKILSRFYYWLHETAYGVSSMGSYISSRETTNFYENSNLIGLYCGKKAPRFGDDIILRDEILVRFRSHSPKAKANDNSGRKMASPKGFLASYKIEYGGLIKLGEEGVGGFIGSPMHPANMQYNGTITWTFETKTDYVMQFNLISLQLGSVHQECQDSLSIYDGINKGSSLRLAQLCGHLSFKTPRSYRQIKLEMRDGAQVVALAHNSETRANLLRPIVSTSNVVSVVYDNNRFEGSFLLQYQAISKLQLVNRNQSDVVILDAEESIRESDESLEESGNATRSCSQSIKLSLYPQNSSQATLQSPNWPQKPIGKVECHWLVYTLSNTDLTLVVNPIEASTFEHLPSPYQRNDDCLQSEDIFKRNFIAVYDGATTLAPLLGRYCLPIGPKQIHSTGRQMLIRYVNSDENVNSSSSSSSNSNEESVFIGKVSIRSCGGQYQVLDSMKLQDRSTKDKLYANNVDCKYYIFASTSSSVLEIRPDRSEFNLASEPTNADCTIGDYIEIRDLPIRRSQDTSSSTDYSRSITGRLLGRFCAGNKLKPLETPGSAITIEFKSDSQNVDKGFSIDINSRFYSRDCPRGPIRSLIDAQFGVITSPNWPHGSFGSKNCRYYMTAQPNQTIELTFIKLRRSEVRFINATYKCSDSINYVADNEAFSLVEYETPMTDPKSPIGGTIHRALLKEVPCNASSLQVQSIERFDTYSIANILDSLGNQAALKAISNEDYLKLSKVSQPDPYTIKTQSQMLVMEFASKDLQPKEGFVAIYRAIDDSKCGGEISYSKQQESDGTRSSNLIQSARFGEETSESDDYIQCSWYIANAARIEPSLISYNLIPTKTLEESTTGYIVFQTIEIPPLKAGSTYMEEQFFYNKPNSKSLEICGLNRLRIETHYYGNSITACGNLTEPTKLLVLDSGVRRLTLRSRNLRYNSKLIANNDIANNNSSIFYRGVRGYFYSKSCLDPEALIGEGLRFRSHKDFPNTSYSPGVCEWTIGLTGGDYEYRFELLRFRKPENYLVDSNKKDCDINDPNLDYLELKTSTENDSPVLGRYCFYNQASILSSVNKEKRLLLSMKYKLDIRFVAGLKQLSQGIENFTTSSLQSEQNGTFGFDLQLVRVKNQTEAEFCTRYPRFSIYSMIKSKERGLFWEGLVDSPINSLYPKNVHCEIDMNLEVGNRFNFTFRGIFELEVSKDCQNDYIQLDEFLPKTNTSTSLQSEISSKNKKTISKVATLSKGSTSLFNWSKIGRWCGKTRPAGFFLTKSNKIRVTFHSNDRIQGRGFLLEYSVLEPIDSNGTETNGEKSLLEPRLQTVGVEFY